MRGGYECTRWCVSIICPGCTHLQRRRDLHIIRRAVKQQQPRPPPGVTLSVRESEVRVACVGERRRKIIKNATPFGSP